MTRADALHRRSRAARWAPSRSLCKPLRTAHRHHDRRRLHPRQGPHGLRGDGSVCDWLQHALDDPFGHGAMGCTAANLAERFGIGRERQGAYAVESQRRVTEAIAAGHFKSQIVGIPLKSRKGTVVFDTDEHVRPGVTAADLAKLRPVFREGGTVTPGNASGINDGAAALVLASVTEVKRRQLQPVGRVLGWGLAGVPPEIMGVGLMQALAVIDGLGLDPDKVNPNGGAVALGHPLGATGAILAVKALYELQRIGGRYGLVTMCIGGGQGIAVVLENLVR